MVDDEGGTRDSEDREVTDDSPLLFCPFCRECYEGETLCPDHELALVPFDKLPKRLDVDDRPGDEERLALYDLRFGRGALFFAAVTSMVGFVLPMVTTSSTEDAIVSTGIGVASLVAPNLFVVPAVGFGLLSILFRRRSPRAMRGARLVVPALGAVGAGSLAYTLFRIRAGAAQMSEDLGASINIEPESGVWVMAIAMAITLVAGFRLGHVPRRPHDDEPHGAGPDGGAGGGDTIVVD